MMEAPRQTRIYLTPEQSGATKILSFSGFRLVIVSADGKTYYFDVPGQRFVSSFDEIVPTITPFTNQTIPTQTATIIPPYP